MRALLEGWGGFDLASEALGLALAFALLVALRFMGPPETRKHIRPLALALVLHVGCYVGAHVSPEASETRRALGAVALTLLLASIARSGVLLLVDVGLGRRMLQPLPKISRDIIQALAYAAVAIAVLRSVGVEPGSLLTTSALLTAVLGLSLQETLGNLFAGIAIQMQRPFDVGDWIQFDADIKHIGRVIEINWRATKVVTLDEVEVIVPNASLAKAPITNYTKPTLASRRSIYVHAPYDVPPAEVASTILASIRDAPGVLETPPPTVVTNKFDELGVEYWVRFFTDQFHKRDGVDGGVRDRIWYALRRAEIPIPYPNRTIEVHEVNDESRTAHVRKRLDERAEALRCVDFLNVLSRAHHDTLAAMTHQRMFGPGEVIVQEGADGTELFIVERGEVSVTLARGGKGEVEVARLGAGKFFGEMALMTGDRRHATVRARTACRLLEVPHDALKPLLEASPNLAERISEVLAKRQAELEAQSAEAEGPTDEEMGARTSVLLDRVRRFFAL